MTRSNTIHPSFAALKRSAANRFALPRTLPFTLLTTLTLPTALTLLTALLFSAGCASMQSDVEMKAQTAAAIAEASMGKHRSETNIARNVARHPVETLTFFGLESDMTVIEVLPGSALWYSEIIAPVVRDEGQLIIADYDVDLPDQPEYRLKGRNAMLERFEKQADVFGAPKIVKMTAPQSIDLGADGSVDMVLTFRSTHGWIRDDAAEAAYAAFFDVLKPGGVLGVVQHRASDDTDTTQFNGYVAEDRLIAIAEGAGFVLEASSDVNANPKDKANYEGGVWTLPPRLRLGDVDKAKYLAIGESDRMTLRFRKPS
ncbi:MAG: class I SAM-dependent methyltransferase [Myxococcota bacterium]